MNRLDLLDVRTYGAFRCRTWRLVTGTCIAELIDRSGRIPPGLDLLDCTGATPEDARFAAWRAMARIERLHEREAA